VPHRTFRHSCLCFYSLGLKVAVVTSRVLRRPLAHGPPPPDNEFFAKATQAAAFENQHLKKPGPISSLLTKATTCFFKPNVLQRYHLALFIPLRFQVQ
jgi:hypothetical protein